MSGSRERALRRIALSIGFSLFLVSAGNAALIVGPISDFGDGTQQGWVTPASNTVNAGGYLEVSTASRLAVFNDSINGTIDPAVTAIELDLLRPSGQTDLEIRLVLFGPGTSSRWTSTLSQPVPGDGVWRRFAFSVLEADLTRVLGNDSYGDLTSALDRIMFRHDAGPPSFGGTTGVTGVFWMDDVVAIPEPSTATLLLAGFAVLGFAASRARARSQHACPHPKRSAPASRVRNRRSGSRRHRV